MTYMLLLNCALKLVEEIILYYDARSKKHQNVDRVKVHARRGEDHSSKLGYPSKEAAMLPLRVSFSS